LGVCLGFILVLSWARNKNIKYDIILNMNEKIIIPESAHEGTDLYDGFILNVFEGDEVDFSVFDRGTVENIYTRLLHYADVMKYENKPGDDPWKYTEAQELPKKLGVHITENQFRLMTEECEVWLYDDEVDSAEYDRDYFDDENIQRREEERE
jgi:hypothetical protein